MSLYSYLISEIEKANYREPEVLAQLLRRLVKTSSGRSLSLPAGWVIHYGVGFVFAYGYELIWKHTELKPSSRNGALLGFISGLIGVAGWHTIFTHHPDPPPKRLLPYYRHLIVAHMLFGVVVALAYSQKSKTLRVASAKV